MNIHNVFIAVFLHTQKCTTHTHQHTHTQSGEVSLSEPWFVTTGATADLSPWKCAREPATTVPPRKEGHQIHTHTHTHTHTNTQTLKHSQKKVQNRTTSFNSRWFSTPCPHVPTLNTYPLSLSVSLSLSLSHTHTHTHTHAHTHAKMRKSNYQLAFLSQGNLMHWVRASHLCLVITLSLLYTPFNKL